MARHEVYTCDICGEETRGLLDREFITTGREATPAGSSEDVGKHVDLCPTHWKTTACLRIKTNKDGRDFLDWVKATKAARKRAR